MKYWFSISSASVSRTFVDIQIVCKREKLRTTKDEGTPDTSEKKKLPPGFGCNHVDKATRSRSDATAPAIRTRGTRMHQQRR